MPETIRFHSSFVNHLKDVTERFQDSSDADRSRIHGLLNGAAGEAVLATISAATRARDGIFFSGHAIALRAAGLIEAGSLGTPIVRDPSCGAGDLLLAYARHLPLCATLGMTIAEWSKLLHGIDLHAHFVLAARWRLLLLAMQRHSEKGDRVAGRTLKDDDFPHVIQGNYMRQRSSDMVDVIVSNPPFGHTIVPKGCEWAEGRTQLAGLFLDQILRRARPGQQVVAILPDVLRSGYRYRKWRRWVSSHAEIKDVHVYGRFDARTDVDVFLLNLRCREGRKSETLDWGTTDCAAKELGSTLETHFAVAVGAVVPHRHPGDVGPWRKYLDVTHAPARGETIPSHSRRFNGRTHLPPFVTIRRTSNPGDSSRLVPTLVLGEEPVAVENHLIVLSPIRGGVAACRALMKVLQSESATAWVNSRMRCRHIATNILSSLPVEIPGCD
ncbi:N-6 DNA methylase [Sinimarinibacterium flocculans]|uniref:N-6 DNA methylase n=1 Tax=Sinimarinibacterium flocculans TaxID=985250 RepID=UPI003518A8DF